LGPWQATFHIPGSAEMPANGPFVRCYVPRQTAGTGLGTMHVIITNLTARAFVVSYQIYGYDAKGERVSYGDDHFGIGGHEVVNRGSLGGLEIRRPRVHW
jgi:hypothetical protein